MNWFKFVNRLKTGKHRIKAFENGPWLLLVSTYVGDPWIRLTNKDFYHVYYYHPFENEDVEKLKAEMTRAGFGGMLC